MLNTKHRRIQQTHQHTPWHELWRQPLASMIRMPWWIFFATMGCIYVLEIFIFGLVLSFDVHHITGEAPMGIPKSYAFALETFLSNGFDSLRPDSRFTYGVAVLDLITGLITLSTLTAVVFAKLSSNERPLVFSNHLCITNPTDGHLFCRFVTSDRSQWLNVNYMLSLIYDDELEPGIWQRQITPLPLLNVCTPQLSQTATLTHKIDGDSPITQLGFEWLLGRNSVIVPMVEGIDETTGSSLVQTHVYSLSDIRLGYRFSDLVTIDKSGHRHIKLKKLNDIVLVTTHL